LFDDLVAMFYENVVAAYSAYATQREGSTAGRSGHLRASIEVATALFHFREHLPSPPTRAQVVAACPDYRLIADVVNAAKHRVLSRPTSEGPPLVKDADDIKELTIITFYRDADGEYSDARTVVNVSCADGVQRNLDNALTTVLNYWGGVMKAMGAIDFSPQPLPERPGSRFVSRDEARGLTLEAMRGVRFAKSFQLMKFDPDKGSSEPIDLTGSEVEFSIYKPITRVDVNITASDGGEPIVYSISLTEEQSAAYQLLTSEEARHAFLKSYSTYTAILCNSRFLRLCEPESPRDQFCQSLLGALNSILQATSDPHPAHLSAISMRNSRASWPKRFMSRFRSNSRRRLHLPQVATMPVRDETSEPPLGRR